MEVRRLDGDRRVFLLTLPHDAVRKLQAVLFQPAVGAARATVAA
jgi:hypothetical protein